MAHLPAPSADSPLSDDDPASALFAALMEAFAAAQRAAGGEILAHYRLGGRTVRVVYAGEPSRKAFHRATAHRACPPTEAVDLTIRVWDTASTGVNRPRVGDGTAGRLAGILDYNTERFGTTLGAQYGLLSCLDRTRALAYCWIADAAAPPEPEFAAPFRFVLQWWFAGAGMQLVHGGAVGDENGAVLLVGRGGSGKSTTTLTCLAAGMQFLGDDYVLMEPTPQPRVHSLYCSGKLCPDAALRNPSLRRLTDGVEPGSAGKHVVFADAAFSDLLAADRPIRAIAAPTIVDGRESKARPASGATVLTALAASSIFQLPGAGAEALQRMSDCVRRVPTYTLELGTDPAGVVQAVRGLIATAS